MTRPQLVKTIRSHVFRLALYCAAILVAIADLAMSGNLDGWAFAFIVLASVDAIEVGDRLTDAMLDLKDEEQRLRDREERYEAGKREDAEREAARAAAREAGIAKGLGHALTRLN